MAISIVMSIIKSSILTAPLILVLMLHARFFSKSSNPNVRLGLWSIIGSVMLFPTLLHSLFRWGFSLSIKRNLFVTDYSAVARAFEQIEKQVTFGGAVSPSGFGKFNGFNIYFILATAYLLIAFLVFLSQLIAHAFSMRNLRRWSIKVTDKKLLSEFEALKKEYQIKSEIPLVYNEKISSPMLIGLFRPTILLPKRELSREENHYVLSHELTHYMRKDLWLQLLFLTVSSIYWLNPLTYFMQKQVESDIELACDIKVVAPLNQKDKQSYCYTILSFFNSKTSILTTGFSNKNNTQRRMESILNKEKKKKGLLVITAILALTVVMGACMYGAPSALDSELKEQTPPPIKQVASTDLDEDLTEEVSLDPTENLDELSRVYNELALSTSRLDERPTVNIGWPVAEYYYISYPYGWGMDGSDFHTGMDITGKDIQGKDVVAAADGEVARMIYFPATESGYGTYIIIDHGEGLSTLYAHLDDVYVEVGQKVSIGEKIGSVGSSGYTTGPLLHFEVALNGVSTDPYPYLVDKIVED